MHYALERRHLVIRQICSSSDESQLSNKILKIYSLVWVGSLLKICFHIKSFKKGLFQMPCQG